MREGRTQSGIRVYVDDVGPMSSGYTLVHWEDAKNVDWCLNNGYYEKMPDHELPIVWDTQSDTRQPYKPPPPPSPYKTKLLIVRGEPVMSAHDMTEADMVIHVDERGEYRVLKCRFAPHGNFDIKVITEGDP